MIPKQQKGGKEQEQEQEQLHRRTSALGKLRRLAQHINKHLTMVIHAVPIGNAVEYMQNVSPLKNAVLMPILGNICSKKKSTQPNSHIFSLFFIASNNKTPLLVGKC